MRPGVASSSSPGRVTGRALRSAPLTVVWLASCGGTIGPAATSGAPLPPATCGGAAGCAGAAGCDDAGGAGRVTAGFARGSRSGATTVTVGSVTEGAGAPSPGPGRDGDWARAASPPHET